MIKWLIWDILAFVIWIAILIWDDKAYKGWIEKQKRKNKAMIEALKKKEKVLRKDNYPWE